MKSYKIKPNGVRNSFRKPEVKLEKRKSTKNEESLLSCENFLHVKNEGHHNSEWDYSASCSPEACDHLDPNLPLESPSMRGRVTSPYDVTEGGQSVLDAACMNFDPDRVNDSHFDILEGYSFLWETFKEEDASPSSTSPNVTTTAAATSASTTDEETISSSTKSCEDQPPSQSPPLPTAKQKASVDCPPDDVGAFFGHPLTRATSALNGEEVDTNASAVALLHEYINLPVIDRDDLKVGDKLNGFLDIISGQRSDPPLSTTQPEASSSPTPTSSHSPDTGQVHHDGVSALDEEVMENSNQDGDVMAMPEYVNIFLQEEFHLDKYLIDGQADSNTSPVVPETTSPRNLKRAKSVKEGLGSALQTRGSNGEVKRAPRKSRAKSSVVTSTTNGLTKHGNNTRAVTKDPQGIVCHQTVEAGVFAGAGHQFRPKGAVVATTVVGNGLPNVVSTAATVPAGSILTTDGHKLTTNSSGNTVVLVGNNSQLPPSTVVVQQQPQSHQQQQQQPSAHHQQALQVPASQLQLQRQPQQVLTLVASSSTNSINNSLPCSPSSHVIATVPSSASPPSSSSVITAAASVDTHAAPPSTSSQQTIIKDTTTTQNASYESLVLENNYLKKALSEKIRSRQSAEESLNKMPTHNNLQFLTDEVPGLGLDSKFSPMAAIKQEESYLDSFDHQYAYGNELANTVASLTNCSGLPMTSCANGAQSIVPVAMTTCDDTLTSNDANNNNGLSGMAASSLHHLHNGSIDHSSLHHQHRHQHHQSHQQQQQQQQQQNHMSHSTNNQAVQDAMIVQSSQGQYFQVLQPLQPLESHPQVTSSNPNTTNGNNNTNNATANYYNYVYPKSVNPQFLETDKQVVVERYLHQQHQFAYSNGYAHFLHADNYNMKSPDSGFHEPCLSPNSAAAVALKETPVNGSVEGVKEKPKKKKSSGGGGGGGGGVLVRQYSSSGSDKGAPRSPAIQKLEVNTTGYSYFLETPISTTQRKDEDRVTYLNKSQYYGLTLDFNSNERIIKCAVVKSVIVLAFREEKGMEEERKAWEFWHGRQHSYKQRILDIDTKNCQGVLPQNIEEISFNAVAVRWNPMEGPVRVNIAVHCLSTDFSNQKGVKGIPLHVQIDTYEQSPKDNHLVHRGYCQIKAFCDKGAERKTRDEERRRAAKVKPDEFGNPPVTVKSRKKTEEAFHEPCERSEFYSMADTTTPPVFFNPLHENTEFIHKSLSLGVVPSQDEEIISSLPTSLELSDSCDDYYTSSPAKRPRRDSSTNLKEQPKVLLYVRERHETVYTALMLEVPTLHGLLRSIEQKYSVAPSKVKNFYKKSKKGILVKLDDNIVRHYSHEATFVIEMNMLNENGDYEIILIEHDPVSS